MPPCRGWGSESTGWIVRSTELYYWDSYWIVKGLLVSGMAATATGMVRNLLSLLDAHGHVPNGTCRRRHCLPHLLACAHVSNPFCGEKLLLRSYSLGRVAVRTGSLLSHKLFPHASQGMLQARPESAQLPLSPDRRGYWRVQGSELCWGCRGAHVLPEPQPAAAAECDGAHRVRGHPGHRPPALCTAGDPPRPLNRPKWKQYRVHLTLAQ